MHDFTRVSTPVGKAENAGKAEKLEMSHFLEFGWKSWKDISNYPALAGKA